MDDGLDRLAKAVWAGTLPNGVIENGELRVERLKSDMPDEAGELVLDLYKRLPEVRITDLLVDVDKATGFTDAFTHLRTGAPCKDIIGLLNVILAEGLNLRLNKMAVASNTHDFFQLSRLSRCYVESDAINQALAMVIEAHARLPMAQFWGQGLTASSDGQFFPTTRQGEAMKLINAKYGNEPGLKSYTHISDQFGPFAIQLIPATVGEAPYMLDGLVMTRAGRRVREQYADTGGFMDLVFDAAALLAYRFIPRIRDLPSKRLHVFDPKGVPTELRGLIGNRIRENTIIANWPDVLRNAATMASGMIVGGFMKARDFGGKPRFFGMGLLSLGDRITGFLAFWVEIASLRPPVGGRAGCIGRIEGTIHPTEPPQAGGGPGSRNHGPLRNVPTAVPGWRWQRTPCRLAPAARVASDATAGADGWSPDHARSPHTGGSIRGDVRDVPARCKTSNSTGGRGRRTCTGRPDARTDSNRRADPQDTSAISATRGHPDSQSPEIRQKPARSGRRRPHGAGHPNVPRVRTAGSVPRPCSQDKRRETGRRRRQEPYNRERKRPWQKRGESPEFRPFPQPSTEIPPSELLRKLASFPRQHDLAVAFREFGRVERTLFMIDWLLDIDMQRRASLGLNKGEAHHALKSALRIGRQ